MKPTIVAIDPGNKKSAYLFWNPITEIITDATIADNNNVLATIRGLHNDYIVVIEMVACYGMPVGKEVFETCLFIGRLIEASTIPVHLVYRKDIKLHFCQSARAKDSNIRQALIDRFGKPGNKKNQGKTYGLKKDLWSALAIAIYWSDKFLKEE